MILRISWTRQHLFLVKYPQPCLQIILLSQFLVAFVVPNLLALSTCAPPVVSSDILHFPFIVLLSVAAVPLFFFSGSFITGDLKKHGWSHNTSVPRDFCLFLLKMNLPLRLSSIYLHVTSYDVGQYRHYWNSEHSGRWDRPVQ